MSGKIILRETNKKRILKLELSNKKKNNALSLKMLSQIIEILSKTDYINKFNCLLFTGSDNGSFSSGADLYDIKKLITNNKVDLYNEKLNKVMDLMNIVNIPIISLLREYCFGAGFMLALNSDIIIASEETLFCIPATKLKIKLHNNQLLFLKKKLNNFFLNDLILSSRKVTAQEAYNFNIISTYIKQNKFDEFSKDYIKKIASLDKNILQYYTKFI